MGRPPSNARNNATMKVVRLTKSLQRNLPRPSEVRQAIFKGTLEECQDYIMENAGNPENQSSREVSVELIISDNNTKDYSTTARPMNGLREVKE